jgi:hypothetical protein
LIESRKQKLEIGKARETQIPRDARDDKTERRRKDNPKTQVQTANLGHPQHQDESKVKTRTLKTGGCGTPRSPVKYIGDAENDTQHADTYTEDTIPGARFVLPCLLLGDWSLRVVVQIRRRQRTHHDDYTHNRQKDSKSMLADHESYLLQVRVQIVRM